MAIHTERSSVSSVPSRHSAATTAANARQDGLRQVRSATKEASAHANSPKPFATASANGPRPRPKWSP